QRQGLLRSEHGALDVGAEDLVEMLLGDRADWSKVGHSGVGEHDVDMPLFLADLPVDPVKVLGLGDVSLNGGGAGAGGCRRSVQFRLAAAGDVDLSALPGKLRRRGHADAGAAAGDEGDLAVKFPGHRLPPLPQSCAESK